MKYTRDKIANLIAEKLATERDVLRKQFLDTRSKIGYFFIDNLLPEDIANKIYNSFPDTKDCVLRKSLKEYKYTAYQMDNYDTLLEEVTYAFQDTKVVNLISEICELDTIYPDENLYAGGLSLMTKDHFLNPHLDNSHDKDRNMWRVLNLLYYVTPNWEKLNGGNLELWPNGLKKEQITITSKFNRLIVMATHQKSWHSVSKVNANKKRCCVSNYYFSDAPLLASDTFHVTSFRGRPTQKVRDYFLRADNSLRMFVRKIFKKGVRENPHQYKK